MNYQRKMFVDFRIASKTGLCLIALLQFSSPLAVLADDETTDSTTATTTTKPALQGAVEDTSIEPTKQGLTPPAEPLATPVLPKQLQGGVEKVDEGSKLHGQAEDEDGNLQGMSPKSDNSEKLLKSNASLQNAGLSPEDLDAEDKELAVQWDKWRNRFLWAIQSGVQEILNNSQDGNLRWDPRTQTVVRQFPLGTAAWFYCQVTADRRIVNFKFLHGSGYPNYDQAVQEAIAALAGSSILRFPAGSHRLKVEQAQKAPRTSSLSLETSRNIACRLSS
jgi:hypothetical protein